jgi:3-deoxy-D-manno-octulosonic acid kinase
LPVPTPIAACYARFGATYTADIITARLSGARTLAQAIEIQPLESATWADIGRTIARFHAIGVHHADLNANNIMLLDREVYLLDFDRGRIRARGGWEADVIARLRRSLNKLAKQRPIVHFNAADWSALTQALRA